MSNIQSQFSVLKQTADPVVADAIQRLVENGEDHELNRINVLDFSKQNGLDEERVIAGFLHASRLGLFDLTWNVLCPGCGGVLDAHSTLKSLRHDAVVVVLAFAATADELGIAQQRQVMADGRLAFVQQLAQAAYVQLRLLRQIVKNPQPCLVREHDIALTDLRQQS